MDFTIENLKKMISNHQNRKTYNYLYNPITNQTTSLPIFNGDVLVDVKTTNKKTTNTNFAKLIINQKINYILSKPYTVDNKYLDKTSKYFNTTKLNILMEKMSINASINGIAWLQLVYNSKQEVVPLLVENIIPIYNEFGELIYIIKYTIEKDNKNVTTTTAEIWNETSVEIKKWKSSDNSVYEEEKKGHYTITIGDKEVQQSFGILPFICLENNIYRESDLLDIESLIETYNSIVNGYVDNIEKFMNAVLKLKGYSSDTESLKQDLAKMKEVGAVAIPEGGDIEPIKIEIPYESRVSLLDIIKKDIFSTGRAVDQDSNIDAEVTNIAIKNRYAQLDTKASQFATQLKSFYQDLMEKLSHLYSYKLNSEIEFNFNLILNTTELIDNCVNSTGIVSQSTILANHPFVTDIKKELKALQKEKQEQQKAQVTEQKEMQDKEI